MAAATENSCCDAVWRNNPLLTRLLGLCPLLALTDRLVTGAAIGILFALVYAWTQWLTSATRHLIPAPARLVCQALYAACGVTLLQLLLQAYYFELTRELGVYLPVLAGCCLIIARAEEYAGREPLPAVLRDSLVTGAGVLGAVLILAATRELIAYGTVLRDATLLWHAAPNRGGYALLPPGWGIPIVAMPSGALLTLGGLLALRNAIAARQASPAGTAHESRQA